jgi:regulatory protein
MKITKISRQKKKGRYNIFIDDEFAFGVYEDTLIKFSLASGDEIEDKLIDEIKDTDEFNHAKRSAFYLLSYRQRSRKELEKKLKEKKISGKNINKVLDYLEGKKFINDNEFAKMFFESLVSRKPVGKSLLKRKLKEKGIEDEIIENLISAKFNDDVEMDSAVLLLRKYSKKIDELDKHSKKKKIYQVLYSRGFGYDVINRVWNELYC